jgi:hypothetical protein
MTHASRALMAGFLVGLAALCQSPTARGAAITGRWLGQDRHDYCGAITSSIQPNGVQDIHIVLSGLPPRHQVVFAEITGLGFDAWQYKGVNNQFGAVLLRKPGATTADLYLEPQHNETGRQFCVKLTFDDGSVVDVYLKGGKADLDLRMLDAAMAVKWVGQDRHDHAGPGPSVGPDGLQDVRLDLSKLAPKDKVSSILIEDASGTKWSFGPNPEGYPNAEFLRNDKAPSDGSLFFQADRDLKGRKLTLSLTYENGKKDSATVTCGRSDPKLAMPALPVPRLSTLTVTSRWLGQNGGSATGPGDVHIALSGLSPTKSVAAAVLSDSVRGVWVFRAGDRPALDVEAGALPLGFRRGTTRSTADLDFSPIRNETNTPLTLRLVYQDGESAVATIAGGACDPNLRAPAVDRSETVAKPGDDLSALAGRFGTVRLAKGEYLLKQPLVLARPMSIVGEPGSVLKFSQAANDASWTAAIKIHSGGTTLRGFAVRFAGKVRWRNDVSWSPAVIGTTDNFDAGPNLPKVNLTLANLDLEGPPPSGAVAWEEAPKLLRAHNATSGQFTGNTLRGGVVELFDGPWVIEGNEFRGTVPGSFSPGVFAVHDPHELIVRNNRARKVEPSGKTWRFLVLTNRGDHDRVENNVIEGIGPRDDDKIPGANSPETILTESYHLWFEGKPAAISPDGRVVRIAHLPGLPARTGDVVSILSGTGAGQWRRIAQRIEPTVYLLDAPLPRGVETISIAPGFVNDLFAGNSIDARGGGEAMGFVLAGNQYGCRVQNNRITGSGQAWMLMAYPSETPSIWGWSHAPFLGGLVEGNTIEDSARGGLIGVFHGGITKSNKGRVYMTLTLKGNTVRWSEGFLSRLARTAAKQPAAGITLGYEKSLDLGELTVTETDNRIVAPSGAATASALKVHAAVLNGRAVTNQTIALPAASASASTGQAGSGSPRR